MKTTNHQQDTPPFFTQLEHNIQQYLAVLEKMLIEATDFEKSVKREVKSSGLGTINALRAKVKRLDVEIALERAKRK